LIAPAVDDGKQSLPGRSRVLLDAQPRADDALLVTSQSSGRMRDGARPRALGEDEAVGDVRALRSLNVSVY
jgi:hypothetical protein